MYKSPIELLIEEFDKKIVKKQDADIYQAVLNCGVNVDKDELIRALEYDRGQYEKGFREGVEFMQKWIPIEQFPMDKKDWYLTCDHKGNRHTMYHHETYEVPFCVYENHPRYFPPKWFMYLPDPPEEVE